MTRTFHTVMGLLLLFFIRTGINGEDSLKPAGRSYNIRFLPDKAACYYLRHFSTSGNSYIIAIVANGEIETSTSHDEDSNWTSQIKDFPEDDDGNHSCHQSTASKAASKVILGPSETSTLQCVLLTNTQHGHCQTWQQEISLMWVDEDGVQIPGASQQQSSCVVTLMLALQSPVNRKFRCQVTVEDQVQTSVDVWLKAPGRGRGIILEPGDGHQGHNQDVVGAAVGVVGCVVLTTLIAAFAVKRKRANRQLPDESCNTISSTQVMNGDDLVYADIIHPAGSDAVWVQECEATEYACIRYE